MQTVLIIDDAVDICFLLQHILISEGIKSDFVHSLSNAAVALETKDYPVVLLDNHLPDGLGLEFIDFIRANYPVSKIIMMSAYDNHSDKSLAGLESIHSFIAKPFTREIILATVGNILINTSKETQSASDEIEVE